MRLDHPSFPLNVFPAPLRDYIAEVSAALPCPPEAIALALLAALGSSVGNTRRVMLKRNWSEPTVIWCVVIMRSGTLKSPAHDAAVRFLREAQNKAFAEHKESLADYERSFAVYEKAVAAWRRDKDAPDDPPTPPEKPICTRHDTSDATVEALADILENNLRGVMLERDELAGWFGSFDRYAAHVGGDVPAWLSMHRAGPITVDRKTGKRTIHVPSAHVCICGTIQPETLRRILTPEYFDCGLPARLILTMPTPPAKEWSEASPSDRTISAMRETFNQLLALKFEVGEDGLPRPLMLPLSYDAKKIWITFYNQHAAETETLPDAGAAAWAKIEAYAARIALIFALVQNPGASEVDFQSMADAIRLVQWLCAETRRVYIMLSGDSEPQRLEELNSWIIRWIQRNNAVGITARDLKIARHRRYENSDAADADLSALAKAGYGKYANCTGTTGRPRIAYRPNKASSEPGNGIETRVKPEENHSFDADTAQRVSKMNGDGIAPAMDESDPDAMPLELRERDAAESQAVSVYETPPGAIENGDYGDRDIAKAAPKPKEPDEQNRVGWEGMV
ncbi:MAG TPA: DUF3987 domain-containing protein [Phycisphaerae bacterium]|nr:DUF3987 domain-containing protein [Phycisphaerae bacterium]